MTALIPYDPVREIQRMRHAMDRLWQLTTPFTFTTPLIDDLRPWSTWSATFNRVIGDTAPVEMYETDGEVVIRAEMPGVSPDQIVVEEQDGWLSMRAEQAREDRRQRQGWTVYERAFTGWRRTLRLPASVNADQASAHLENGILTIRLPKVSGRTPLRRRIKVNVPRLNLPKLKLPKLGKNRPKIKVLTSSAS